MKCPDCGKEFKLPLYINPKLAIIEKGALGGYENSDAVLVPACPYCFYYLNTEK